jgi:bifunctional non-homologous end joining protein LigD
VDDIERPDRVVFDLDPGEDVDWRRVIAAARLLRERLEQLSLQSFVRTSGGKGLHVVLPLEPRANWDTVKNFSHALAQMLAEEQPDEFIATASKQKRHGRIFIDYLRNGRGATAVASYTLRARPGAPAAVPLDWDELGRLKSPAQFGYANLRQRLARLGRDPWEGFRELRQRLPKLH